MSAEGWGHIEMLLKNFAWAVPLGWEMYKWNRDKNKRKKS